MSCQMEVVEVQMCPHAQSSAVENTTVEDNVVETLNSDLVY